MNILSSKLLTITGMILVSVFLLTACTSEELAAVPTSEPVIMSVATATPLPTPTNMPLLTPTSEPTATPMPPTPTPAPLTAYSVAFVTDDDVLNVRSGPGVGNDIVGTLSYDAAGLTITDQATVVDQSNWVPIAHESLQGWVNRYFLTESIAAETFCADPAVEALINDFKSSVSTRDGNALAELVHPQRSLLIRHSWWNPEVRLTVEEAAQFFDDTAQRQWGTADGSGLPITGSISEVILPLLEKDLLNSTVSTCNEISGGNTAGILQLPAEYQSLNYISQFRPAADEFDWGTWVVGVEYWAGKPYLAFLIHYNWEI